MVIVSNGPGEISTWVKPVVEKLNSKIEAIHKTKSVLIKKHLVLVPCPNATGSEHEVAKKWNYFETISRPKSFWHLLIKPHKYHSFSNEGIVIFLGGDQFWTVLLSLRLGFQHITYAEWVARWPHWNNRIAAMSNKVKKSIPKSIRNRCTVVGDLMADLNIQGSNEYSLTKDKWIALLPGSKKAKLSVGIPFFLELADQLSKLMPECHFLLPVAPTTCIQELEYFSNAQHNSIASKYKSGIKQISSSFENKECKKLITLNGTEIELIEDHPAHKALIQCQLALTTVGANTAELGALGIPMIVIVPTQHIHVMEAWDGLMGIISRLPILKYFIGILISLWRMRKNRYMAWPNITANKMIVPERIGDIYPKDIAKEAFEWISSPERLKGQKEDLRSLRGQPGAAERMAVEIINLIPKSFVNDKNV